MINDWSSDKVSECSDLMNEVVTSCYVTIKSMK